jgi:hypothetical protein
MDGLSENEAPSAQLPKAHSTKQFVQWLRKGYNVDAWMPELENTYTIGNSYSHAGPPLYATWR